MTIEIERRFLLKNDDWKREASAPQVLQQGYLSVEKSAPSACALLTIRLG